MSKFKNQLNREETYDIPVTRHTHLVAYLLDKCPFSVHTYGILLSIAGAYCLSQVMCVIVPSSLDPYVPAGIALCFILYQIRLFKVLPDDKPAKHNTLGITLLCMLGGLAIHVFYGAILGLGVAYWFHHKEQHGSKVKSWAEDIKDKATVTTTETKNVSAGAFKWDSFKDDAVGCGIAAVNGGLMSWAGYEFIPFGVLRYLVVGAGTCIAIAGLIGILAAFINLCIKEK